jgi:hypothetical protein
MVTFLRVESNEHHDTYLGVKHINKYFHQVKINNVNSFKPFDCEIMKGSQKLHYVLSISNINLPFINFAIHFAYVLITFLNMFTRSCS